MDPTTLALAGTCVLGFVLWHRGRQDQAAIRADWSFALTPACRREYEALCEHYRVELRRADVRYGVALRMTGEARRRMLDLGLDTLIDTAPSLVSFLKSMAELSRYMAAICPTPALSPRHYRSRRLVMLAALHTFLHQLTVTVAERFRFRLYVLRRGIRMSVAFFVRQRGRGEPQSVDAAWQDFHTLTADSLESFRALLMSAFAARPVASSSVARFGRLRT